MKKCTSSAISPVQSPPCSDATRDLLRRKVLEKLGSPKEKVEGTQGVLEHAKHSTPQVEGVKRRASEMTERRLLKSPRSIPSGLDLNNEDKRPPTFSHVQGKRQVSRQMSTPDTPPLVIVSSPAVCSLPLVTTPLSNPSQTYLPLVQSTQPQPSHVPVAMPTQQPKIFCVTTTAASLGIDTPPPSADDYLVKPSSAGVYPTTSSAHLAGNSPANVSSVRESPNSSHSNMSPLAYAAPAATTEMVQTQQEKVARDEEEPSQKKSMVMLPVLKELIEKTYPKLPASLVGAEDNHEKFLIIECERLVTLPNLLGPVRPARLVLCSMGQFSFQCLQKELYSGSLSDNLLFSVALKSLTSQSEFRLCSAYGMLENNPVGGVLHAATPSLLHGSVPSTQASTSSHTTTSKWGDSISQLIDSHRCLMWFSPSDAERSAETKEGEDPDEKTSNCALKGIDKTSVCKNCRSRLLAVQKPYKQQPVAQVEEKPKKGLACKDGPSVTEPPSEDPISSQHKIQFFGSHHSRPAGTSPLMVSTVRVRGRGSPRSAPVNAAAQAENQAVKRHLAEKIMARLHKASQPGVDPHSPTIPLQFVSPTVCRGSTSPLTTHVLPSLGANDIITSKGARGKSRKDGVGMRKRSQDYARGHTPSVGGPQKEDSPRKMSKSDNPLTPSKPGSVPIRQDIL